MKNYIKRGKDTSYLVNILTRELDAEKRNNDGNEEETKKKKEKKEGGRIAQKESKEKDIGAWEMEKE